MSRQSIVVLGAGSWGTALAAQLARCGHQTVLWGRDKTALQRMSAAALNDRYLPGITLPANLRYSDSLPDTIPSADIVVLAVPSSIFEPMLSLLKPLLEDRTTLVWACKGFCENQLLHEVLYATLADRYPGVVLSGPNFAAELARGLPTATTIACSNLAVAQRISAVFHGENLRAYASNDMVGVQLAGALKNIYAIASGISDGLGFGANARAALITRGLAEINRLGEPMGARQSTLSGLSGVGDLVLTCTDDQSRNRRFGLMIGRGASREESIADIGQVVEGALAVRHVKKLAEKYSVELPIAAQVHAVLYEDKDPKLAVKDLLSRAAVNEQ